jgi:hypothetical protein
MLYEQAKPLVEKLMHIAVLYHASPALLRQKMHEALEYIPHLDAACLERGCACHDPRETNPNPTTKENQP